VGPGALELALADVLGDAGLLRLLRGGVVPVPVVPLFAEDPLFALDPAVGPLPLVVGPPNDGAGTLGAD